MDKSALILILSLFSASFIGSWHCATMCGPIACFVSNQGRAIYYHLGRLVTYTFLGAMAGAFGEVILNHFSKIFYLTVINIMVLLILIFGFYRLQIFSKRFSAFQKITQKINLILQKSFKKWMTRSSFVVGLLTGFLPCSWLLMFVFSAVATHSALSGGLVLFVFWLGGLPALIAVSSGLHRMIKLAPQRQKQIAAAVLVFAAIFSSYSFSMNLVP